MSIFVRISLVLALVGAPGALAGQWGSPAGPVPVQQLESRRAALLDLLDGRPAVFGTARIRSIEGDYPQDSDFRQDNDFFYLTGLEAREGWLAFNIPEPGSVTLYLPPRNPGEERWTGPMVGPGPEAVRRTGIRDVRSMEDFPPVIAAPAPPPAGRSLPLLVSPGHPEGRAELAPVLQDGRWEPEDPAGIMAALRLVKDAEEIRRLRRAVEITADGIRSAWSAVRPGMWEYQLEARVEFTFRAEGAERVGFPSIVGSGPNATILHYDKSRRRMEAGELVVMDVGAEFGYYSADVTRTFPVSGRFSPRQRALYDLVLGAQEAALAGVRPGVTMAELSRVARSYMDRNSGDLCGDLPCTRFFVHGLGHWLGMDVHDVGDYATPLARGMVITLEPGVYLQEEGIGIRIEDDVLVTDTGYELLSGELPRRAAAIEAAMARGATEGAPST